MRGARLRSCGCLGAHKRVILRCRLNRGVASSQQQSASVETRMGCTVACDPSNVRLLVCVFGSAGVRSNVRICGNEVQRDELTTVTPSISAVRLPTRSEREATAAKPPAPPGATTRPSLGQTTELTSASRIGPTRFGCGCCSSKPPALSTIDFQPTLLHSARRDCVPRRKRITT